MSKQGGTTRYQFDAIGTHWEIDIQQQISETFAAELQSKITKRIARFDKTYSRFRSDSTIMQFAHAAGRHELPKDAAPLFDFYDVLYRATQGKVTPLIGNTLSDAGYDADYSLRPKESVAPALPWHTVATFSAPYLTTTQPVIIDVGAAGKGYLVDIIGELLKAAGIHECMIDAGGDILRYSSATEFQQIGLEHPFDASLAIGVVALGNESICGSASNRRSWNGYHHIMDPDSAVSVKGIVATWVVAKTGMQADGLATALFFVDAQSLRQQFEFEYLLVRSDMTIEQSDGLKVQIF